MPSSLRFRMAAKAILTAAFAVMLFSARPVAAQTLCTWTGLGSDSNWGTSANWSGSAPSTDPSAYSSNGNFVVLTGSAQASTCNLEQAYSVYSLTFDSNAGAFTVGGSTLTIGAGGITNNSSNAQTINAPIVLAAAQSWTNSGSATMTIAGTVNTGTGTGSSSLGLTLSGSGATTISGIISGTGSLTIASAGTVTISGTNTYTGGTIIAGGGTLTLTSTSTATNGSTIVITPLGPSSSSVVVSASSTLAITGPTGGSGGYYYAVSNPISIPTGVTLTVNSGHYGRFNGVISGAGAVANLGGSGNYSGISGTNTYTGGTIINTGTFGFFTDASFGAVPASFSPSNIQINSGGILSTVYGGFVNGFTLNVERGIVLNGNASFDCNTFGITVNGVISGTGSVTRSTSTSTLTLNGLNTYTGTTSLPSGTTSINTLRLAGSASSLGAPLTASATISIGSGSTSATLVYTGSGDTTDRVINLAGSTGGATLDQSGGGTLEFQSSFTAAASSKTLTLQGSTGGVGQIDAAIVNGSSGSVSLIKSGTGTWTLQGNSTYTGGTAVNAGTLNLTGSLTSAITVASGAILAGTGSTTKLITLSDGSFLAVGATPITSVGVTVSSSGNGVGILLPASSSVLTSGGSVNILTYGSGTATTVTNFNAAFYHGGGVVASGGNVTLTVGAATTDIWSLTSGGTWDTNTTANFNTSTSKFFWGDAVQFTNSNSQTVTISGTVAPGSVLVSTGGTSALPIAYTFSGGTIAGNGSLTLTGTASGSTTVAAQAVFLSVANTYTGGTTIGSTSTSLLSTMTVNIGAAGSLGTGTITVNPGARYTTGTTVTSAGTPFLRVNINNLTTPTNVGNNIALPTGSTNAGIYAIQMGLASGNVVGSSLILSGTISGGGTGYTLQLDSPTLGDSTTNYTLSGANTGLLTGTSVRLNRGYLVVTNPASLGSASLNVLTNSNTSPGNLVFGNSFTLPNSVTISTSNNDIGTNNFNGTMSGTLTSSVAFSKVGLGTLTLTHANAISSPFTAAAGTLAAGNAAAFGTGVGVSVAPNFPDAVYASSGATVDLAGQALTGRLIVISGTGVGGTGALINSSTTDASLVSGGLATIYGTSAGGGISGGATVTISGGGGSGATGTASLGVTTNTFTITNGGSGYTTAPTVTLSGNATATAIISGGVVTGITITSAGSGYSSTAPTITFSAPTSGTTATGTGNATNYLLAGTTLTAAGSGYTSAPTVTLSSGTATVVASPVGVQLAANSSIGGSGNITIPFIYGGFALTKVGTGTLTLSGVNTYTGATIISAGTLKLSASGALPSTSAVTLGGGTLGVAGSTTNGSNGMTGGTLTLTANSTIDFTNATTATLSFGDSSSIPWTGTLTITGYTGLPYLGGGSNGSNTTQLFIGSTADLTVSQLSDISFSGFPPGTAIQLSTGEVVPTPEPTMLLGIAAGALGLSRLARRRVR